MKSFDLIVLGAGSGLDVAVEAAKRGWRTAIVNDGPLGGTCLNRGCIPSKMIIHAAEVAETIQNSQQFGVFGRIAAIDFARVTGRASMLVDTEARAIQQGLKSGRNPVLLKGKGRFVGKKIVDVNGKQYYGKRMVIATGARATIPPIPGLENVPYLTSTEALRLKKLPKEMIIIGGGYIGAELGHFYAALGCEIRIIQRGPLLISREDKDVSALFTGLWKQKHGILCDCTVERIEKKGNSVVVHTLHDGKREKLTAEKVLIATGITPNSEIGLGKTGVKINERGFVIVNKYLETSTKGIWALGDVAGKYLFKHSANLEAEYILQNFFGRKLAVDYYPMPHAIFTHPQIAGVGLTEQEVMQQKRKYVIGKYEYKNTGMGAALAEKEGFVKFIVDAKTEEILGCHIIGPEASTLIHEVVVAMKASRLNALQLLRSSVHVHPALSEVVQRAAGSVPI